MLGFVRQIGHYKKDCFMNIYIDIELAEDFQPEQQTREGRVVCEVIREYYTARLSVLKDEIDREEHDQLDKGTPAFMVIPLEYEGDPIRYFHYSKELVEKMNCAIVLRMQLI
jgi:hypothetical protein